MKFPPDTTFCKFPFFHVHSPSTPPTFYEYGYADNFIEVPFGSTMDIEIVPEIIKTDENLKTLKSEVRECFFDGERKLKFFKIYTKENCELECISNFTFEALNCATLTQPYNIKGGISLCNFTNRPKIVTQLKNDPNFSFERNCSCLPTCNSLSYRINYFHKSHIKNDSKLIINIRMRLDEILLFRKFQQFNFSDIVSYVGGILGQDFF